MKIKVMTLAGCAAIASCNTGQSEKIEQQYLVLVPGGVVCGKEGVRETYVRNTHPSRTITAIYTVYDEHLSGSATDTPPLVIPPYKSDADDRRVACQKPYPPGTQYWTIKLKSAAMN